MHVDEFEAHFLMVESTEKVGHINLLLEARVWKSICDFVFHSQANVTRTNGKEYPPYEEKKCNLGAEKM